MGAEIGSTAAVSLLCVLSTIPLLTLVDRGGIALSVLDWVGTTDCSAICPSSVTIAVQQEVMGTCGVAALLLLAPSSTSIAVVSSITSLVSAVPRAAGADIDLERLSVPFEDCAAISKRLLSEAAGELHIIGTGVAGSGR